MILKNKIAIITGARQGIGYGIALAFAKEGCQVVVSDIDLKDCEKVVKEIEVLGVQGLAVQCDVANKKEVERLVSETMKKFNRLDILVNNAGIFPFKPFLELSESDWQKVLDINLKGAFFCAQAAAKVMKPNSKIINISSIAAFIGFEGLTHYCASKGGMNGMIRAIALELAPKKINVNAIAPGAIDTPGLKAISNDEVVKQTIAAIPWARMGTPDDIAQTAVFLASDKADYITGQIIIVDGGFTLR